MIRLEDLNEAILECQGERNPDARTCQKLAAFYVIKDHMYPDAPIRDSGGYSNSAGDSDLQWREFENFGYQSDTEFAKLASEIDKNTLMRVIDELMTVLEATNPRLYHGVLKKMLDNR